MTQRKTSNLTTYIYCMCSGWSSFNSFLLACFESRCFFFCLVSYVSRSGVIPFEISPSLSLLVAPLLSFLRRVHLGPSLSFSRVMILAIARFFVPAGAVSGAGSTPDLFPPPNNTMCDTHTCVCARARATTRRDVGSCACVSWAAS